MFDLTTFRNWFCELCGTRTHTLKYKLTTNTRVRTHTHTYTLTYTNTSAHTFTFICYSFSLYSNHTTHGILPVSMEEWSKSTKKKKKYKLWAWYKNRVQQSVYVAWSALVFVFSPQRATHQRVLVIFFSFHMTFFSLGSMNLNLHYNSSFNAVVAHTIIQRVEMRKKRRRRNKKIATYIVKWRKISRCVRAHSLVCFLSLFHSLTHFNLTMMYVWPLWFAHIEPGLC